MILFKGLMKMTAVATKNANVSDVIGDIIWRVQTKGVSPIFPSFHTTIIKFEFRVMFGRCIRK